MIPIKIAAPLLHLSRVRVRQLCQQGRIRGAVNHGGRVWEMPNPPVIDPPKRKGKA